MKQTIFTGFSPNLEWEDAFFSWRLIFQPWRWRRGQASKILENQFKEDFNMPYAVSFESGRTSLSALLSTSGLSPESEVAIQAYTCVAVPNAVIWAGFKPLYIDCEKETLTMSPADLEKKITPQTKAVIIQYTFGQVGHLKELLGVAKNHNLVVIEDAAHVIHGGYENKLLGSWGDVSIVSFGRDKAMSSVFGGLALVRDEAWAKRLEAMRNGYPPANRLWILKQLLHPVITFKAKLFYDTWGIGKLIFSLARRFSLVSKSVEAGERRGEKPDFAFHQMPNALALLALRQYKKVSRFNVHRKKIAALYHEALSGYPNCDLPQFDHSINFLRFPIGVDSPEKLIAVAKQEKIYLGDWYENPIAPRGVSNETIHYTRGSCPVAEESSKRSVNLPTDIHISFVEAGRVVDVVQAYLEKTS